MRLRNSIAILTFLFVVVPAVAAADGPLGPGIEQQPHNSSSRTRRLPAVRTEPTALRQAWYAISEEVAQAQRATLQLPQIQDESVVRFQDSDEAAESAGSDEEYSGPGRAAFEMYCLDCHDAQRSLQKSKSQADWLATIRRMAAKDGASVPASEFESIADYLSSVAGTDGEGSGDGGGSAISLYGTISTIYRSGTQGYQPPAPSGELDHAGFFPDVWVGMQWQNGPMSARATACTSCHNESAPDGHFMELVDATVALDLMQVLTGCCYEGDVSASVEAGRFITPFGAFAGMSHPGIYRTVSNPLMFMMGRRVETGVYDPPRPVLPHPYSDEGVRLKLSVPFGHCNTNTATLDVYGVNGLEGPRTTERFLTSRSYWDNNNDPAVGGRATVGNRTIRFGGSIMSGHFNNDRSPQQYYKLAGADVTFRYEEWIRAYAEYAIRTEENSPGARSHTYGTVIEGEVWILPKVSFLARYDTLYARGAITAGGLRPNDLDRTTWGVNIALPGGSELLFNHEIWRPEIGPNVDVLGFRWFASF